MPDNRPWHEAMPGETWHVEYDPKSLRRTGFDYRDGPHTHYAYVVFDSLNDALRAFKVIVEMFGYHPVLSRVSETGHDVEDEYVLELDLRQLQHAATFESDVAA